MTIANRRAGWAWLRTGALAVMAGGAVLFPGCGEKAKSVGTTAERPIVSGVEVATVSPSLEETFAEAVGTVRARTIASVAAQVMGRVTAVHASEGTHVPKGALLVTIDDAAIMANLASAEGMVAEAQAAKEEVEGAIAQAQANRTLAEATYGRFRALHEEKVVTRQEFEEVEVRKTLAVKEYERALEKRSQVAARIVQAKGQANAARAMLSYTKVTAPFAGVVTEKKVEPGSMAVPGVPLLTLEDTSRYRIEAAVPETFLAVLRVGSRVRVALDSEPGKVRDATVSEVVPLIDPASRTFAAKADLRGDGLRTGMYGRLLFSMGKKALLLSVPRKALSRAGGFDGVFIVTPDNVARLTMVKTGGPMGDRIEILSGLDPGARVAVSSIDRLVDGAKVEVRP